MKATWIALTMMVACGAWGQSQPPFPTPTKESRPPQKTTQNKGAPTDKDQRGTEDRPLFVRVAAVPVVEVQGGPKAEQKPADTTNKENNASTLYWGLPADTWTAVFTGALVFIGFVTGVVLIFQAVLIRRQVKLAREEFNATHRPKIIVRGFIVMKPELPDGEKIIFGFVAHNIGETPATIVEIRSGTTILKPGDIPVNRSEIPYGETFDITLASGECAAFQANGGGRIPGNDSMAIYAGDRALICLGVVRYVDSTRRIKRETGFCRRYFSKGPTWQTIECDYEYAY